MLNKENLSKLEMMTKETNVTRYRTDLKLIPEGVKFSRQATQMVRR